MNLDNMFSDCEDLSATRGGGLAILNIGVLAAKGLDLAPDDLITAGASKGLLRVRGSGPEDVERIVRSALLDAAPEIQRQVLAHATIMIKAVQEGVPEELSQKVAELTAGIRLAQMRSASVAYPKLHQRAVCRTDKLRPARRENGESDFTAARSEWGRGQKSRVIAEILGADRRVTQTLDELSSHERGEGHRLHHKIAVLRFDGNDFGAAADECKTPEEKREFSETVQRDQRQFFHDLLSEDPGSWFSDDGLQIEVVVYGGDEVTFVTPAWLGWRALRKFYECAQKWKRPKTGMPLTYGGGVVFCHYKAPIHAIKRLASDLADEAKERARAATGNKGNFAMVQVLESFDAIGQDLGDFLTDRYGKVGGRLEVGLEAVEILGDNMDCWRSTLSRRKLHETVEKALNGDPLDAKEAVRELVESKGSGTDVVTEPIGNLIERVGGPVAFVHMLEFWDYAAGEQR
ncbi:MAG: hypothetical protein GC160_28255 [Acidobacteria bacterium]|nr:hypothetical protein [Acidobacteriota bacterium]